MKLKPGQIVMTSWPNRHINLILWVGPIETHFKCILCIDSQCQCQDGEYLTTKNIEEHSRELTLEERALYL